MELACSTVVVFFSYVISHRKKKCVLARCDDLQHFGFPQKGWAKQDTEQCVRGRGAYAAGHRNARALPFTQNSFEEKKKHTTLAKPQAAGVPRL